MFGQAHLLLRGDFVTLTNLVAMARFHFQVSDTEGKIRKGTMEAASMADARAIAHKRGYTVVELREAFEAEAEPVIKIQPRTATSRYNAGPANPHPFQPSLGQRWQTAFPPKVVRTIMGALMLAGFIWMVVGWQSQPTKGPRSQAGQRLATPALNALKLTVSGTVRAEGSSSLGDVEVTVDLPEIPYQQTYEWTKIKHPDAGSFEVKVEFESTRIAHQLIVRARKPGLGEAATDVIQLQPGGGTITQLQLNIVKAKVR